MESMVVERAKAYFRHSDSEQSTIEDVAELFAKDAVLRSPREGIFHGQEEIQNFFELNGKFFDEGEHNIDEYYECGNTVICEGTINGRTTAGREYEGIGLVDIMEFDENKKITELRVYLDYSGILTELPEDVPDFRD